MYLKLGTNILPLEGGTGLVLLPALSKETWVPPSIPFLEKLLKKAHVYRSQMSRAFSLDEFVGLAPTDYNQLGYALFMCAIGGLLELPPQVRGVADVWTVNNEVPSSEDLWKLVVLMHLRGLQVPQTSEKGDYLLPSTIISDFLRFYNSEILSTLDTASFEYQALLSYFSYVYEVYLGRNPLAENVGFPVLGATGLVYESEQAPVPLHLMLLGRNVSAYNRSVLKTGAKVFSALFADPLVGTLISQNPQHVGHITEASKRVGSHVVASKKYLLPSNPVAVVHPKVTGSYSFVSPMRQSAVLSQMLEVLPPFLEAVNAQYVLDEAFTPNAPSYSSSGPWIEAELSSRFVHSKIDGFVTEVRPDYISAYQGRVVLGNSSEAVNLHSYEPGKSFPYRYSVDRAAGFYIPKDYLYHDFPMASFYGPVKTKPDYDLKNRSLTCRKVNILINPEALLFDSHYQGEWCCDLALFDFNSLKRGIPYELFTFVQELVSRNEALDAFASRLSFWAGFRNQYLDDDAIRLILRGRLSAFCYVLSLVDPFLGDVLAAFWSEQDESQLLIRYRRTINV